MSFSRFSVPAIALICLTISFTPAKAEENTDSLPPIGTGKLDGQIFVGTTGVQGDKKSNSEEKIVFQRGKFISFAFQLVGAFTEAEYSTEKLKNGYSFRTDITSPSAGHIVWNGTIMKDSINATGIWYRPNMDSAIVWTKGWRQKPADPMHKELDGKTITGTLTSEQDSVIGPETLTFANGKIVSKDGAAYGFSEFTYYANPRYDTLYFTSNIPGPKHSGRRWRGWLYKKQMEATVEWDKSDGTMPVMLKFKGKETKK